jgi:hypothetical protein
MKRPMEIDRIETYQTAAQLAFIMGRITKDDYIAALECLQAQILAKGAAKAHSKIPSRRAMSGN